MATGSRMDKYLKRYFWVFHLSLIVLSALLAALTVSNLMTGGLSTLMVTGGSAAKPKVAKEGKPSARSMADLSKEAWEAAKKPGEEEEPEEKTEEPIKIAEGEYPISDLPVKLNGTLVAAASEYSLAMLKDSKGSATFFVGEGERFMDVEVMKVERDRIVIRKEGRVEQIDLESGKGAKRKGKGFSSRNPMAKSTPLSAKKAPAAKANDRFSKLRQGISKVSDNEYAVSKTALKDVLADPTKFRDGADAKPHRKGGRFSGFELTKVRSGSMLNTVGLKQGDVITGINGKKLNSMNVALDLYQKLSKKKNLNSMTIEVDRGGKTKTLNYKVK